MDYHKLMDLCVEHGIEIQKKMAAELSSKDIFSMSEEDWLSLFSHMGFDNIQTINKTRASFNKLYKICISKGYTDYNPFDSMKLETKSIYKVTEKNVYITPFDLEEGINKLKNKDIGACIIRFFYEGIHEVQDLYSLTMDQLDLENRKIYFSEYSMDISEDLYQSIKTYLDTWVMDSFKLTRPFENSFVKVNQYKSTTNFSGNFSNTVSRFISGAGFKKIHLYGSGFINYLYKKCGSIEKMDELFYADDKVRGLISALCSEIETYGKEYGLSLEGKYIRFRYRSYYESFKIKMQKAG